MERQNAFIHCVLRIDPATLDEDQWHEAWGRVKFYLEIIHQVKFE